MEGIQNAPTVAAVEPSLEYVLIFLRILFNQACYVAHLLIDDSFAVCRRRRRGWFCEKIDDLEARDDLIGVAESRQCDGEGPDVLDDPRDRAEPRLSDGEDLDASGDDVENANRTVVADRTCKDVEGRPVAVTKPIPCYNLCDNVFTGLS